MAERPRIYWLVPATAVLPLLGGSLLALGHHLFYASLAGTMAPTGNYELAGASFSRQQFNIAIGTAFAFLVKALLALSVGVAYTQAFWRTVRRSRNGQTLSTLDTMHSILDSMVGFLKPHVWWRHPMLVMLAVISWTLPIASIVTPATLSVKTAHIEPTPSMLSRVPMMNFINLNFLAGMSGGGAQGDDATQYCYDGPSLAMSRVATAVTVQGEMLPITPTAANSSWDLNFWGPSLQCSNGTNEQRDQIWQNLFNVLNNETRCSSSYGYLSWLEDSRHDPRPFVPHENDTFSFRTATFRSDTTTAVWFAMLPEMFRQLVMGTTPNPGGCMLAAAYQGTTNVNQSVNGLASAFDAYLNNGSTLIRCEVVNASYTTHFEYINGQQNITVRLEQPETPEPLVPAACVTGPADFYPVPISNSSLPKLMTDINDTACSTLNTNGTQCLFEPVLAQRLSYQAVVDAFLERVLGYVGLKGGSDSSLALDIETSVTNTILMDTSDLGFVANFHTSPQLSDGMMWLNLQEMTQIAKGFFLQGLATNISAGTRGPFEQAIEQLFQNMTISILSEPILQSNPESPFAPTHLVNVSLPGYENVYVYTTKTLWIAYGLAILFAVLAVAAGGWAMASAGVAFERNFSTIVRIGRASVLSEELRATDGSGAAPLPKHLHGATMIPSRGSGEQQMLKDGVIVHTSSRSRSSSPPSR